jgi:hypothetical protein
MEGCKQDVDWSYWQHFEPRWTPSPEEWQWLYGTGGVGMARGSGFAVAVVGGIISIGLAGYHFDITKFHTFVYLMEGLASLGLGCLLLRGKQWASIGLMALMTSELVDRYIMAYTTHAHVYVNHLRFWWGGNLLVWAVLMRVFYVAIRAEQRWAAVATQQPEADAQNHITP